MEYRGEDRIPKEKISTKTVLTFYKYIMWWIKDTTFIECNRFYQISNLKEASEQVKFTEFPIKDKKIDFDNPNWDYKKIKWELIEVYSAEYGTEWRMGWNLIFSDDEWFFKLGSWMTKVFRALLNRIASLENPRQVMEISVFQKTEIKDIDGRQKDVTYKNIALWINGQTVQGKYDKEFLETKRVKVNDATGKFKEIDYSLENQLMIEEFENIKNKLAYIKEEKISPEEAEVLLEKWLNDKEAMEDLDLPF